jgi:hypothetical protein
LLISKRKRKKGRVPFQDFSRFYVELVTISAAFVVASVTAIGISAVTAISIAAISALMITTTCMLNFI